MNPLEKKLIRLAHQNPEVREKAFPLLEKIAKKRVSSNYKKLVFKNIGGVDFAFDSALGRTDVAKLLKGLRKGVQRLKRTPYKDKLKKLSDKIIFGSDSGDFSFSVDPSVGVEMGIGANFPKASIDAAAQAALAAAMYEFGLRSPQKKAWREHARTEKRMLAKVLKKDKKLSNVFGKSSLKNDLKLFGIGFGLYMQYMAGEITDAKENKHFRKGILNFFQPPQVSKELSFLEPFETLPSKAVAVLPKGMNPFDNTKGSLTEEFLLKTAAVPAQQLQIDTLKDALMNLGFSADMQTRLIEPKPYPDPQFFNFPIDIEERTGGLLKAQYGEFKFPFAAYDKALQVQSNIEKARKQRLISEAEYNQFMSEIIPDPIPEPDTPVITVGPTKGAGRAREKIKKYGGDWSQLSDIVRHTIIMDDALVNSKEYFDAIQKEFERQGIEIVTAPEDRYTNPTPTGYGDIIFNVRYPNGVVGEIQMNTPVMMVAKNEGHHYYEETRTVDALVKEAEKFAGMGKLSQAQKQEILENDTLDKHGNINQYKADQYNLIFKDPAAYVKAFPSMEDLAEYEQNNRKQFQVYNRARQAMGLAPHKPNYEDSFRTMMKGGSYFWKPEYETSQPLERDWKPAQSGKKASSVVGQTKFYLYDGLPYLWEGETSPPRYFNGFDKDGRIDWMLSDFKKGATPVTEKIWNKALKEQEKLAKRRENLKPSKKMANTELRSKLIRLAHAKPELRKHLLPLLKTAGGKPEVYWEMLWLQDFGEGQDEIVHTEMIMRKSYTSNYFKPDMAKDLKKAMLKAKKHGFHSMDVPRLGWDMVQKNPSEVVFSFSTGDETFGKVRIVLKNMSAGMKEYALSVLRGKE